MQMVVQNQLKQYQVHESIGTGCSCIVYRATTTTTMSATPSVCRATVLCENDVAIKCINLNELQENEWNVTLEQLHDEIVMMTQLRHNNLMSIYGSFVHEDKLCMVMPHMYYGSCQTILNRWFRKGMHQNDELLLACILKQVLQGLIYLHHEQTIHRDIKGANILIDRSGVVKLSDFGVSCSCCSCGSIHKKHNTIAGTLCWMSPEMIQNNNYDNKTDIWSFGILALELAFGEPPNFQQSSSKVVGNIVTQNPPFTKYARSKDHTSKLSSSFHKLVEMCLQVNTNKRANAATLLKHKFFNQVPTTATNCHEYITKILQQQCMNK